MDAPPALLFERRIGGSGRVACFVGLAPLPPDRPNMTVRRYARWAAAWGCDGAVAVNLHPFVTTPSLDGLADWCRAPDDASVRRNVATVGAAAASAALVVACWGASPLAARSPALPALLSSGLALRCLGTTRSGTPVHPASRSLPSVPDLLPWAPPGAPTKRKLLVIDEAHALLDTPEWRAFRRLLLNEPPPVRGDEAELASLPLPRLGDGDA
jgi:hypothetical protein